MIFTSLQSLTLATGTTALVLGSLGPAGAFTTFTDRAAWQAAVNAITRSITTIDTFSTNIAQAQSIALTSGIISVNSFPPTVAFGDNSVSGGVYNNATDGDTEEASKTVTWTFPNAVRAFGADFIDTDFNGLTLTGNFDGTGNQTLLVNNTIGQDNGFLGVIGSADFVFIVFGNASNDLDIFSIDNASFAVAPPTVPEPNTVAGLIFSGIGLLVACRSQRI